MAFDAIGAFPTQASGSSSGLTSSRKTIADNFDTFLTLLTAQLKNQNPLDPLDTNQFTSQMVEFTAVEQALKTNESLETLIAMNQSSLQGQAMGFVGMDVVASGAQTELSGGSANWDYSLDEDSPAAKITIRDANGSIVFTETKAVTSGTQTYTWNGKDNNGLAKASGSYSVTIDARDADGNYIPVTTQTRGIVTGVDFSGVEPILLIGDNRTKLSSVTSANIATN